MHSPAASAVTAAASSTQDAPAFPPSSSVLRHSAPFPLHLLPTPLQSFTRANAASTAAPVPFVATTALALASAAIGHGAIVYHDDHGRFLTPNLYFLLVSEITPQRSQAFALALSPLSMRQARGLDPYPGETAAPPYFFTHIPRGKFLRRLLTQSDHALASLSLDSRAPSALFRRRLTATAAADEAALLAAYHGSCLSSAQSYEGHTMASHPCAALLWSMSPAEWQTLDPNPDSPLLSRFLLLNECESSPSSSSIEPTPGNPSSPNASTHLANISLTPTDTSSSARPIDPFSAWHLLLSTLLDWRSAASSLNCYFSLEAESLLTAFINECAADHSSFLPDQAARLALLFQVIHHAHLVTTQTPAPHDYDPSCVPLEFAEAAIALARWFAAQQHPLLHPEDSDTDPFLDKVLRKLRHSGHRAPIGFFCHRHNLKRQKLYALVESYPNLLRLDQDPKTTPGRKTEYLVSISSSRPDSSSSSSLESVAPLSITPLAPPSTPIIPIPPIPPTENPPPAISTPPEKIPSPNLPNLAERERPPQVARRDGAEAPVKLPNFQMEPPNGRQFLESKMVPPTCSSNPAPCGSPLPLWREGEGGWPVVPTALETQNRDD